MTDLVRFPTLRFMKLSISEVRKRLPELVRQVRKDAGAKIEITVRDEVVAELRAALPEPEPGGRRQKARCIDASPAKAPREKNGRICAG